MTTPNAPTEDWIVETLFKILDRYGASMVVIFLFVVIVLKVMPELVKVWVDKIRAETEMIRKTGDAVADKIPAAINEMKIAIVAVEGRIVDAIKNNTAADADRRIEGRLETIERVVVRPPEDVVAPVSRAKLPSRSG
jgi:hypothetical protein